MEKKKEERAWTLRERRPEVPRAVREAAAVRRPAAPLEEKAKVLRSNLGQKHVLGTNFLSQSLVGNEWVYEVK